MRVLIVDDEMLARERLKTLLGESAEDEVCGEASNGAMALEVAAECHPEVVLLDIRMPGVDGLQAARELARLHPPPAVIFTTAYEQHALAAFETRAVDYLLKPVRRERLAEALDRVRERHSTPARSAPAEGRAHICARGHKRVELIPIDDVIYLQAGQKYVTVRHRDGEALIDEPLKALEAEFGERFMRIHRNALVAREHLAGLERDRSGQLYVAFKGIDDRLEVSRRHAAIVRERVLTL
ncbi:LytR/AlgR family response regulator transcription factor [Acidihalobacter ferrooxydans]|uniref:DNA-binding response regulator n=1 Tax=Acidihalobacter ferrooxydans TaxID=1765967 RepID=A0A1P8UD52_9GAMM|nr:LytTR family DNA-binding domain-containing protein [Acidihalobacter ferrooxydans]APZ41748.1 DNA-binding response regulator [Acidihalobacter ferrooxydans]